MKKTFEVNPKTIRVLERITTERYMQRSMAEPEYESGSRHLRDIPVFGFVGRIDIQSAELNILLQGFTWLVRYLGIPAELWIIGDGKDILQLKTMVWESGVKDHVKFWGEKSGPEKLNIMADMDYLCLTSFGEQLTGTILEAARLGVPSIVGPKTDLMHCIKTYRAGLCLEACTAVHMCETMLKASHWKEDGVLTSVRQNARTMVEQAFSAEVVRCGNCR